MAGRYNKIQEESSNPSTVSKDINGVTFTQYVENQENVMNCTYIIFNDELVKSGMV